jgi:hypothetical protein
MAQREDAIEERTANRFVDRIVASDVFAQNNQLAIEIENRGGMDS